MLVSLVALTTFSAYAVAQLTCDITTNCQTDSCPGGTCPVPFKPDGPNGTTELVCPANSYTIDAANNGVYSGGDAGATGARVLSITGDASPTEVLLCDGVTGISGTIGESVSLSGTVPIGAIGNLELGDLSSIDVTGTDAGGISIASNSCVGSCSGGSASEASTSISFTTAGSSGISLASGVQVLGLGSGSVSLSANSGPLTGDVDAVIQAGTAGIDLSGTMLALQPVPVTTSGSLTAGTTQGTMQFSSITASRIALTSAGDITADSFSASTGDVSMSAVSGVITVPTLNAAAGNVIATTPLQLDADTTATAFASVTLATIQGENSLSVNSRRATLCSDGSSIGGGAVSPAALLFGTAAAQISINCPSVTLSNSLLGGSGRLTFVATTAAMNTAIGFTATGGVVAKALVQTAGGAINIGTSSASNIASWTVNSASLTAGQLTITTGNLNSDISGTLRVTTLTVSSGDALLRSSASTATSGITVNSGSLLIIRGALTVGGTGARVAFMSIPTSGISASTFGSFQGVVGVINSPATIQAGTSITVNGCVAARGGTDPLDCTVSPLTITRTASAVVNSGNIITSQGGRASLSSILVYANVQPGGFVTVNNFYYFPNNVRPGSPATKRSKLAKRAPPQQTRITDNSGTNGNVICGTNVRGIDSDPANGTQGCYFVDGQPCSTASTDDETCYSNYCTASSVCGQKPSGVMRRRRRSFAPDACPAPATACPLTPSGSSYECVDLSNELGSCGSCGHDCLSLPGVNSTAVECTAGRCVISYCLPGYELNIDSTECVYIDRGRHARAHRRRHLGELLTSL